MNITWNKVVGFMGIVVIPALLISMNFFAQPKKEFISQYDEERLKNDSLMGEIQTLQKQLWEKEQELLAKNNHIDSLTLACTHLKTEDYQ